MYWIEIASMIISSITLLILALDFIQNRKENRELFLKAQANKVSCWVDCTEQGLLSVTIRNNSESPIYNVFVFEVFNKNEDTFEEINNSIASEHWKRIELFPPGDTKLKLNHHGNSSGGGHSLVCIVFTDCSGNGWYRSKWGKLTRIDNYEKKLNTMGIHPPY